MLQVCVCLCVFVSLVVNVMQRDSIPSEVDYETRQGVYSICLQLARYALFIYLFISLCFAATVSLLQFDLVEVSSTDMKYNIGTHLFLQIPTRRTNNAKHSGRGAE